ncbi:MAG TPA: DUF1048 domain-containing protein [Actinocatenispora sp.]
MARDLAAARCSARRFAAVSGILDVFEEGVADGKGVLELVCTDVAAFCDDLVQDAPTYADGYQESIRRKSGTAEKQRLFRTGTGRRVTVERLERVATRA